MKETEYIDHMANEVVAEVDCKNGIAPELPVRHREIRRTVINKSVCVIVSAFIMSVALPLQIWSSSRQGAQESPKAQLSEITESYNNGKWNECLNRLQDFIRNHDSDANAEEAKNITYAYLMLGNVCLGYSDYLSAEKYYRKGLKMARKWKLYEDVLKLCSNLAAVSCYLDNKEKAEEYVREIMAVPGVNKEQRDIDRLLVSAFIERTFGDWRKSVSLLKQSIEEIDRGNVSKKLKVTPYSEITEMYEENAMLDSALFYLGIYEKVADEFNMSSMVVDAQRLYMRLHIRLGHPDLALHYQERYSRMQDSLLNKKMFLNKAVSFEKESQEKTDRQIRNMQITISRSHLIMLLIGMALAVSVVFIIIVLRQKKNLHLSYRRLYDMNLELMRHSGSETNVFKEDADAGAGNDVQEEDGSHGNGSQSRLAKKILEIMDSTDVWCSPDFSLASLAAMAETNTRYVSQAINESCGKNFRTFINEYRISEAVRRITDVERYGKLTIQAIGESVGFMSRSNFISAFKKQTGLTPSVYQKIAEEKRTKKESV